MTANGHDPERSCSGVAAVLWTSASVVDEHVADVVVGGSCALGAESDAVTIVDRCGEYFAEMGCCGVFDELLGAFDDDDHLDPGILEIVEELQVLVADIELAVGEMGLESENGPGPVMVPERSVGTVDVDGHGHRPEGLLHCGLAGDDSGGGPLLVL